jgi:hypothetical protein
MRKGGGKGGGGRGAVSITRLNRVNLGTSLTRCEAAPDRQICVVLHVAEI